MVLHLTLSVGRPLQGNNGSATQQSAEDVPRGNKTSWQGVDVGEWGPRGERNNIWDTIKAGLRRKSRAEGIHRLCHCWAKSEVSCPLKSNGKENKGMDTGTPESPLRYHWESRILKEKQNGAFSYKGYCGGEVWGPQINSTSGGTCWQGSTWGWAMIYKLQVNGHQEWNSLYSIYDWDSMLQLSIAVKTIMIRLVIRIQKYKKKAPVEGLALTQHGTGRGWQYERVRVCRSLRICTLFMLCRKCLRTEKTLEASLRKRAPDW